MLVLTRKEGEGVVIGDEIEICVVAIGDTTVRLGIAAPRETPVFRKEVYLEGGRLGGPRSPSTDRPRDLPPGC